MGFRKFEELPSCADINRLDIVDYLASIGFQPKKIRGNNFWYLSPLRAEKTPSFKVNRKLNCWYDFGTGEGYSLIDFGVRYYNSTIKELLVKLSDPFYDPLIVPHTEYREEVLESGTIKILEIGPLKSDQLIRYLLERRINLVVAQKFCKEATYQVGGRIYYAISFENKSGGFELRNKYFKGSSSPKDSSFFNNGSDRILVFEGFFDFLSFQTIYKGQDDQPSYLILNSLSFFESSYPLMELHRQIHLFLDNDRAGERFTAAALTRSPAYRDERSLYKGYKDLNAFICLVGNSGKLKGLDGF